MRSSQATHDTGHMALTAASLLAAVGAGLIGLTTPLASRFQDGN